MHHIPVSLWSLALPLLLISPSSAQESQSIFDGKTLDGWQGNAQVWRVEDGAITASIDEGKRLAKNEFIFWKDQVSDFELTLDYRITGGPQPIRVFSFAVKTITAPRSAIRQTSTMALPGSVVSTMNMAEL